MSTRLEILKRYLQENPADSFLRYALALEFIALNEKEQALKILENLIEEDPDYLAAYYMAGKMSEESGDNIRAINWYAKGVAVAKNQKNDHTKNELSEALKRLEEE